MDAEFLSKMCHRRAGLVPIDDCGLLSVGQPPLSLKCLGALERWVIGEELTRIAFDEPQEGLTGLGIVS